MMFLYALIIYTDYILAIYFTEFAGSGEKSMLKCEQNLYRIDRSIVELLPNHNIDPVCTFVILASYPPYELLQCNVWYSGVIWYHACMDLQCICE